MRPRPKTPPPMGGVFPFGTPRGLLTVPRWYPGPKAGRPPLGPSNPQAVVSLRVAPEEAPPGFEPGIADLQSAALPLGEGAGMFARVVSVWESRNFGEKAGGSLNRWDRYHLPTFSILGRSLFLKRTLFGNVGFGGRKWKGTRAWDE